MKKALVITIVLFLLVRILIFATFWQASLDKGGWQNFYGWTQSANQVLRGIFHEYCDWHPPLYYAFTSSILFLFHNQWPIYFFQILFALFDLWLIYKISRLFFPEKTSWAAALLAAIEPHWAWHNFLLVSENLFIPFFLAGFYFFFRYLKGSRRKDLAFSAVFWGVATWIRFNSFQITLLLSFFLLLAFLIKRRPGIEILPKISLGRLLVDLAIFNLLFFLILSPWMVYNEMAYGRFTFSNILSTNFYFYNVPSLLSVQKNISYDAGCQIVAQKARDDLGNNVGDQGDCKLYSKEELGRQLDYYQQEAKNYILADLSTYFKMHLVRAVPFFFQSGYFDMWSAYSGEYSKPDITGLVLKGNFSAIKSFFLNINLKLAVYLLGIIFWGMASLAVFVSCFYSYFRDRKRFIFFLLSLIMILYTALMVSPFVLAKYRFPLYIFFFVPLVYMIGMVYNKISHRHVPA